MPRIIIDKTKIKAVFQWCVFLRTYAQYASMNNFTCSEHPVRIRRSKKRSTGNQPLEKDNEKKTLSERRKNKTRIYWLIFLFIAKSFLFPRAKSWTPRILSPFRACKTLALFKESVSFTHSAPWNHSTTFVSHWATLFAKPSSVISPNLFHFGNVSNLIKT